MLVDGEWVPTFPNARYLFNKAEYDHWLAEQDNAQDAMFGKVQNLVFLDSVKPVVDAGLVDLWRERGWPDLCRPVGTDDFACD